MIKTDKYPIDFETIEKGDVITNDELEKILGHKFGTAQFAFGLMGLQKKIYDYREFTSSHKINIGLCILTDTEASKYNDKSFHQKRRGMVQAHQRMNSVDISELPPSMRDDHQRKVLNQSRYISALRQAKKISVKVEEPKQLNE